MSRNWASGSAAFITTSAGTTGGVGSGAYTLAALTQPASSIGATLGAVTSGSITREMTTDGGKFFGTADFSAGFGTATIGAYQYIAQSKAAGSNVYRWHSLPYGNNPNTTTHANGTGSHGDGTATTSWQLGNGFNRNLGDLAVLACWTRVLSDAEVEAMFVAALAAWAANTPAALWPLALAEAGNAVVDVTGNGANQTSVTGTITGSADPVGFNYSLSTHSKGAEFLSFF